MEAHHSLLRTWLEKHFRNILLFITGLRSLATTAILRTFSVVTSLKGATIIVMIAVPLVIFVLLDVPQESREIAVLCSVSQAIALVVGVGVAIFLGMAQIHSPYHTPRTLLTRQTVALLSALLVGMLLALAVLQGSHLAWLPREPLVSGPFRVSWTHVTLIWFAESLIVLPLYLRYAVRRLGASGLVDDSENHILRELGASRPPIANVVEQHVKILGNIAVTALGRKEYLILGPAFLSLGNLLWKADAAARSDSQLKGRADVVFHGWAMEPLPEGQTDPWRMIYREVSFLHNLMMESSELMVRECQYLRDIGTQAIENEKASVTILAVTVLIKQILDKAVAEDYAEVVKLASMESAHLAMAAVKAALTKNSRAKLHREHLLTAANRTIKGIEDAFVSKVPELHLKESVPKTVVWDNEVLPIVLSSVQRIGRTIGETLTSTPETEHATDVDALDQHWPEGVVNRAIAMLSTLRSAFERSGRSRPAREAAYHIAGLGVMVARLRWTSVTKVAIDAIRWHTFEQLTCTGLAFKSALHGIESIRRIGLTGAFEANDGVIALHASLALTTIARTAIDHNQIHVAFDIIGGKNGVVTILGTCRHKSVVFPGDADQEIMNLAMDLNGMVTSPIVAQPQLQEKAKQALYELDQWSKTAPTSTGT